MPRPLLLATVALTLAAASLASLPTATPPQALDVRRRFVDPSSCCDVDPDMCRGQKPRLALTRGAVLTVVARQRDEARSCLDDSRVASARVRWRVGADGRPLEVVVLDDDAAGVDERIANCLIRVVSSWHFPSTPQGLRTPITVAFSGPPTR